MKGGSSRLASLADDVFQPKRKADNLQLILALRKPEEETELPEMSLAFLGRRESELISRCHH